MENATIPKNINSDLTIKDLQNRNFSYITFSSLVHMETDKYGFTIAKQPVYINIRSYTEKIVVDVYTSYSHVIYLEIPNDEQEFDPIIKLKKNNIYIMINEYNYKIESISFMDYGRTYIQEWASFRELSLSDDLAKPSSMAIIDNSEYRTDLVKEIVANRIPSKELIKKYAAVPDFYRLYPIHYIMSAQKKELYVKEFLVEENAIFIAPPIRIALNNKDYDAIDFILSNGEDPFGLDTTVPSSPDPDYLHIIRALDDAKAMEIYIKHIKDKSRVFRHTIKIGNRSISKDKDDWGHLETNLLG